MDLFGSAASQPRYGIFTQNPSIRVQPNAEQQQHLELFHQESYIYNLPQLRIAARAGTPDEILILFQRGESLIPIPIAATGFSLISNPVNRAPIHEAVIAGKVENVIALIQLGTPVDIQDSIKRTALHYAAYLGHVDVIQVLVQFGATIDPIDIDGVTPLFLATTRANAPNEEHDFRADLPPAFNPIPDDRGNRRLSTRLVPDYLKPKNGATPSETISLLLQLGSSAIDYPDRYGVTPLNSAVKYRQLDVVKTLIFAGSRAQDIPDSSGRTPLHLTHPTTRTIIEIAELRLATSPYEEQREIDLAEFLIQHGVQNIDPINKHGETPFFLAIWFSRIGVARILLKYGSRAINLSKFSYNSITGVLIPEHSGSTPLIQASTNMDIGMVKFLLQSGSAANGAVDEFGQIESPVEAVMGQIIYSENAANAPIDEFWDGDDEERERGREEDLRRIEQFREILAIFKASGISPPYLPTDPRSYFSTREEAEIHFNVPREAAIARAQELWDEPIEHEIVQRIRNEIFFQPLLGRIMDAIV